MQIDKPTFKRNPDFVNDVGTKGWQIHDFDDQIITTGLDLKVVFTEYKDDWCYILVEESDVIFESMLFSDIDDIITEVEKYAIIKNCDA